MIVRTAGPDDAASVAALAADTFPLACPPEESREAIAAHIATALTPEVFAAHLASPSRTLLVAQDQDQLLGYVLLVAELPSDPEVLAVLTRSPTVEVSKCYVRLEQHGRGVAHALMAAAVAHVEETDARGMWLGVSGVNERAQGFYRRSGFRVVGAKDFHLGPVVYRDPVMERLVR